MPSKDWTPLLIVQSAIAAVCTTGLILIVLVLMFVQPPPENRDMLNLILGAFVGVGFANIVGFFFGQKEQSAQAEKMQASGAVKVDPPATITKTETTEIT